MANSPTNDVNGPHRYGSHSRVSLQSVRLSASRLIRAPCTLQHTRTGCVWYLPVQVRTTEPEPAALRGSRRLHSCHSFAPCSTVLSASCAMDDAKAEAHKRRFEACVAGLPRSLNANINPGFILPRRGFEPAVWTGGNAPTSSLVTSESTARYTFRVAPVDKTAHLRKDPIKLYVEKAMQVRAAGPHPLSILALLTLHSRSIRVAQLRSFVTIARGCPWSPRPYGHPPASDADLERCCETHFVTAKSILGRHARKRYRRS